MPTVHEASLVADALDRSEFEELLRYTAEIMQTEAKAQPIPTAFEQVLAETFGKLHG